MQQHREGKGFNFRQENARAYGKIEKKFLQTSGINVIDSSAMSPDLNPIEHYYRLSNVK